jgi:hypothetical protein
MSTYINNQQVLKLAEKWHFGQTRWAGEPYIGHPIAVADKCLSFFKSSNLIDLYNIDELYQTAILHDVLEDCPVTEQQMLGIHNISPSVVRNCTVLNKKNYPNYTEYITKIVNSYNPVLGIVKFFDIEHNSISLLPGTKLDKYMLAQQLLRMGYPILPNVQP